LLLLHEYFMAIAYLLLGTNIVCRSDNLKNTRSHINQLAGKICISSSVYETAAWGKVEQDDYLNQVLKINTDLAPKALLQVTTEIESLLGRKRKIKWGPRTMDIDILYYDYLTSSEQSLILPHPFIAKRRFVLVPLAEIAPDFIHPVLDKSTKELLAECKDELSVEKYEVAATP